MKQDPLKHRTQQVDGFPEFLFSCYDISWLSFIAEM